MQSAGRNFGLDLDDDDNHHVFDDEDAFLNVTMNDDGDGNDNLSSSRSFFLLLYHQVFASQGLYINLFKDLCKLSNYLRIFVFINYANGCRNESY